jgi:hypothetical protein
VYGKQLWACTGLYGQAVVDFPCVVRAGRHGRACDAVCSTGRQLRACASTIRLRMPSIMVKLLRVCTLHLDLPAEIITGKQSGAIFR